MGRVQRWSSRSVVVELKMTRMSLPRLAEFQTPMIFDQDCDFHHRTIFRPPKIMKIIIYILYIHEKVFAMFLQAIPNCGFGYVIILFQSYRISFYIEIPHWFRLVLIYTTKQLSHGK